MNPDVLELIFCYRKEFEELETLLKNKYPNTKTNNKPSRKAGNCTGFEIPSIRVGPIKPCGIAQTELYKKS